jgi:hypothetical protein
MKKNKAAEGYMDKMALFDSVLPPVMDRGHGTLPAPYPGAPAVRDAALQRESGQRHARRRPRGDAAAETR